MSPAAMTRRKVMVFGEQGDARHISWQTGSNVSGCDSREASLQIHLQIVLSRPRETPDYYPGKLRPLGAPCCR